MDKEIRKKILKYIEYRHDNTSDFLLTDDILFSKLCWSKPFVTGIDRIYPWQIIFDIREGDNMSDKGFKMGMLFLENKRGIKL